MVIRDSLFVIRFSIFSDELRITNYVLPQLKIIVCKVGAFQFAF